MTTCLKRGPNFNKIGQMSFDKEIFISEDFLKFFWQICSPWSFLLMQKNLGLQNSRNRDGDRTRHGGPNVAYLARSENQRKNPILQVKQRWDRHVWFDPH